MILPRHITILILAFTASAIVLPNLGNQVLWQDEAQTALISETVLNRGIPYGYDGRNFFSQENGAEYGQNYIWKWHTWLPFYVTAASFRILGHTTFAARLPFAVFGILTIVLLYFFSKELFNSRHINWVSSLLLGLNVPFLILIRQCRWYSMAAFFCLLGLYAYTRMLRGCRYSSIVLVAALFFTFHTHYIYAFALGISIVIHSAIFHRPKLLRVFLLCALAIGINLPWLIWLSSMKYADQYGGQILRIDVMTTFANTFITKIRMHTGLLFSLICLGIFFIARWVGKGRIPLPHRKTVSGLCLLGIFMIITLIVLSAFSPSPFYRYLTPIIPLAILISALLVSFAFRIHWILGIAGTVALVFLSPLPSYIYEISHDYNGPMEGIVSYLNLNGSPNDTVAITYEDLPVKFYTKMRVVGGLTGEDLTATKNARWIVVRKFIICETDAKVREYIVKNVDFSRYRPIVLNAPDIAYENREEPGEHLFRTSNVQDRVLLCQRID